MIDIQGANEAPETLVQFHSLLTWKSVHALCIQNVRAQDDAHCTRDL